VAKDLVIFNNILEKNKKVSKKKTKKRIEVNNINTKKK
jgi:hypothetical protein